MHNASTKQRLSALRRRLGIFTGWQPRWVRERRRRLERLGLPAGATTLVTDPFARADEAPTRAAPTNVGATFVWTPLPPVPAPEPESVAAPPSQPTITQAVQPSAAADATPVRGALAPAKPIPPAILVAPTRSKGRTARGAAVALAIVAVAAGILALGRRAAPAKSAELEPTAEHGAAAPAKSAELEPAAEHEPGAVVTVTASAPSPAPAPAGAPDPSSVEVRRGDTLWHLAAVHLGDPMRWPELHAANARLVRDPDLIFPGQRLEVPRSAQL